MRLAFSTLGCPNWSYEDIFAAAKDLNYNAIEIRGIDTEMYAPNIKMFNDFYIDSTMEALKKASLNISMFTSGAVLGISNNAGKKEAFDYIDLAYKADVEYIRVMISGRPEADEIDMENALKLYNEVCEYGNEKNVTPLIETNGVLADSREMRTFMENIESKNKGVLWDIHHPYRFFNESIDFTIEKLGEYIKYVHIKDSVMENNKVVYKMVGHGDVPIQKAVETLKNRKYIGYLSLEWTKRWCPELSEPGIVFSHYINYMGSIL